MRLDPAAWRDELRTILSQGDRYGASTVGAGQRVNVEYVSANPTGPLHMGHCRGAVVGDSLARLLEAAGFQVTKEYYVNDAGGQVDTLARSVHLRYREALGEAIAIPEGMYPGDYLVPVGATLAAEFGDQFAAVPESEWLALFRTRSIDAMLELIRADLALPHPPRPLRVRSRAPGQWCGRSGTRHMRAKGMVYQGQLERPKSIDPNDEWEPVELTLFRSSQFGDDQDRPIKKSDGSWTYFGSDAAYHLEKAQQADHLVNIWGADHSGTVKRVAAAVNALTDGRVDLDVKLVQMVRLFRAGEPIKMSKRSGDFVTLAEVVGEVGKDVVRFIMLTTRPHTRSTSISPGAGGVRRTIRSSTCNMPTRGFAAQRKGADAGIDWQAADLACSTTRSRAWSSRAQYSRVIEAAALAHEPHRIAFYLYELAAQFHALWNRGNDDPARRFLIENQKDVSRARLELALGIGQIIRRGLALMGGEAAEEMR